MAATQQTETVTRHYPMTRETEKAIQIPFGLWLPKSQITFEPTGKRVHGGGGKYVPEVEVTLPMWLVRKNHL
jgi:hypothetical protein